MHNTYKGKFIVIEGLDGAGIETQAKILYEKMRQRGHALYLDYPQYAHPIGRAIEWYLNRKEPPPLEVIFLLNAADQIKDGPRIRQALKEGVNISAARYALANLAYQCARGFDLRDALSILYRIKMPRPHIGVFLDASPETCLKRKMAENKGKKKGMKELDVYEKNLQFQQSVYDMYKELIRRKTFVKEWVVVDGEKSIEEVAAEVERILIPKLMIMQK